MPAGIQERPLIAANILQAIPNGTVLRGLLPHDFAFQPVSSVPLGLY